MDHHEKQRIVYRLLAGFYRFNINGKVYYVRNPAPSILYEAEEVYHEILSDAQFKDCYTLKDIQKLLINQGLWSLEEEEKLKTLATTIDNTKVELYNTIYQPKRHQDAGKKLKELKKKQDTLLQTKHMFDHVTIESYAEIAKLDFIYSRCILDQDKDIIKYPDASLVQLIINHVRQQFLTVGAIREIARTDPWGMYWNTHKTGAFRKINLTDEHRVLMLYSQMYDNVKGSPDCPPEMVIHNDDLLDGWMIDAKRRAESERGKNKNYKQGYKKGPQLDDKPGNLEIFVPVQNQKQAQEIYEQNELTSRLVVKQRQAVIKQRGEVKETDLPDVKSEITQLARQEMSRKLKGK